MGDVHKQICRLCLEVIPSGDCEVFEETKKEQLEALLINIDFDISDNAVACNRCVEKLQECFDFKSTCLHVNIPFVNVDVKVDIKPVFKEEWSGESTYQENKICRLCMLTIQDESLNYTVDSKDLVFLRDVIGNCMPQMDLNTVHESLICKQCLSNTKKYNDFKKTCLEVEERIQNYRQMVVGYGEVVLEDVLEFKYCDTLSQPVIIKKECSDVDFVDMNIMDCPNTVIEKGCPDVERIGDVVKGIIYPKNKDIYIASVKCEEVDIKDELDSRLEASESLPSINSTDNSSTDNSSTDNSSTDNSSTDNSSTDNESSNRNDQMRTSASNEARQSMYSCPKCPYSSIKRHKIENHKCYSEYKVHKCFICPFLSNSKFLFGVHMASHRGPTKAFACPECSHETDRKCNLLSHFLKHKDKSEVEMYKCEVCKFSTKHKNSFARHQMVHKNPGEISMHKCEMCGFETKYKKSLRWHKLTHEDPAVVNKFKCDKCPYQSKRVFDLRTHMRTHSDEHRYSCEQCTYSSTIRQYLVRHKRMHQIGVEPSESEAKFLCDQCDFQTKRKRYLLVHKYMHDPTKSTLKCGQCEYSTWRKDRLQRHQLQHMELEKTEAFYCATCDFKTKYKSNLRDHIKICLRKKSENDGNKKKRRKVRS